MGLVKVKQVFPKPGEILFVCLSEDLFYPLGDLFKKAVPDFDEEVVKMAKMVLLCIIVLAYMCQCLLGM